MFSEINQETLDIDWFFTNGSELAFVASGGGKLPLSIAKSKEITETVSSYFRGLPQRSEVIINPDLKKVIPVRTINERYLADFVDMAGKGFYTFDKTVLNRFSDTSYHLVAKPTNPLRINELPLEIVKILLETKINGHMQQEINLAVFEG